MSRQKEICTEVKIIIHLFLARRQPFLFTPGNF